MLVPLSVRPLMTCTLTVSPLLRISHVDIAISISGDLPIRFNGRTRDHPVHAQNHSFDSIRSSSCVRELKVEVADDFSIWPGLIIIGTCVVLAPL